MNKLAFLLALALAPIAPALAGGHRGGGFGAGNHGHFGGGFAHHNANFNAGFHRLKLRGHR